MNGLQEEWKKWLNRKNLLKVTKMKNVQYA